MKDGKNSWITMKAKYPGLCRRCLQSINKDELMEWNTETKLARHPECVPYKGKRKNTNHRVRLRTGAQRSR